MWWTLALLACSGSDPKPEVLGELSGCDPVDPTACALPWPSSHFEVSTEAGRRLNFSAEALPVNTKGLHFTSWPLNEKDGYSTLGPMLFFFDDVSLEGTISHTDLSAYAEEQAKTILWDVDDARRVPHFVELDSTAAEGQRVVFMRPVEPLEHDHHYVVGVRGLLNGAGELVQPSPAFAALRDQTHAQEPDVAVRQAHYNAEVFPGLEAAGMTRAELQLAWDFHTVSRDSSLARPQWMMADALERVGSQGPSYTIDSVVDGDCTQPGEHIARTIDGHFTTPLYTETNEPGTLLTRDEQGMPYANGEANPRFMVRIPCSLAEDPGEGGMVLQYGHGLLGDLSEARTSYLAELVDEAGWVLLAQDWTGMSTLDGVGFALHFASQANEFAYLPERSMQGFTELAAGLRMVRGGLAADDLMAFQGRSVVHPTKVGYYGNSQGSILGGAYVALSPDLERAVFGVGGTPYNLLLYRSHDFDQFFDLFKEAWPDGRDIAIVLAVMQSLWDPAEAAGYAHAMNRDPLPGVPAKQVLLQVDVGDAQVTTLGNHIMARAYGAQSVAPGVRPIWGVEEASAPFSGSAVVEWLYTDGGEEPVENLPPSKETDAHECPRREPEAQAQLRDFLETGVVNQYCEGPCVSERAGLCD